MSCLYSLHAIDDDLRLHSRSKIPHSRHPKTNEKWDLGQFSRALSSFDRSSNTSGGIYALQDIRFRRPRRFEVLVPTEPKGFIALATRNDIRMSQDPDHEIGPAVKRVVQDHGVSANAFNGGRIPIFYPRA